MAFGNGTPWSAYSVPPLPLAQIRARAEWFLVLRPAVRVTSNDWELDETTGGFPASPQRSTVAGSVFDVLAGESWVFGVKRSEKALFDFVAVGRHEGNDIWLPDASVSRFHAFLRELDGGLVVSDTRSGNGTWARGLSVPVQNAGPPLPVGSGDAIRFGDVEGVVLNAAGLAARLQGPR